MLVLSPGDRLLVVSQSSCVSCSCCRPLALFLSHALCLGVSLSLWEVLRRRWWTGCSPLRRQRYWNKQRLSWKHSFWLLTKKKRVAASCCVVVNWPQISLRSPLLIQFTWNTVELLASNYPLFLYWWSNMNPHFEISWSRSSLFSPQTFL